MLKRIEKGKINEILKSLSKDKKVIDIGGSYGPFKRANYIIDVIPYEKIRWNETRGPGEIMFNKNTYIEYDICQRKPWPFKDKEFDYSICSHVLEDIRDPLWVCSEIIRISKAGYIEIPSKKYEMTFGVEARNLSGNAHHRWVIDLVNNEIRFTFKDMHIHARCVNKSKNRFNKNDQEMFLCIEWKDNFNYFENFLGSGKENFEFILEKEITNKEMWKIYRKVGVGNFIVRWLRYLKNTNDLAGNILVTLARILKIKKL